MTKNARLNGCWDESELGVVEREATPRFLMKLGIQLHLADLSLSYVVSIHEILVSNVLDLPFTIGFTKPIYSPNLIRIRITLQLMKP